jgi:hypothetical protein
VLLSACTTNSAFSPRTHHRLDDYGAVDQGTGERRSNGGDVDLRLGRRHLASREMVFVSPRTGIVGSKETRGAAAIVRLAQLHSPGPDIVVRIRQIGADTAAGKEACPRCGHDLHQVHCPLGQQSTHITDASDRHHGAHRPVERKS